jgi:hypothetical protein
VLLSCHRWEALSTELKSQREEIGALTSRVQFLEEVNEAKDSQREEIGALASRVQFLEEVNEAKDRELRDQVRQLCAPWETQWQVNLGVSTDYEVRNPG